MRHKLLTVLVVIAVVALFACSAEAATKGKGPVLHMRFDEGGGPTAYDEGWTDTDSDGIKDSGESWNNYDGTLVPGATGTNTAAGQMWSRQGKLGSAIEFDGTNDNVSLSGSELHMGTGAITVEHWIKPNAWSSYETLFYGGGGGGASGYGTHLNTGGTNFRYEVYGTTGGRQNATPDIGIQVGEWNHIVAVFDGENNTMKAYLNGVEKHSMGISDPGTVTSASFRIGSHGASDWFYSGLMDELKVYDYARTAAQIAVDYNAGAASHLSAGTDPNEGNPPVLYLPFDENTGTTAYDRSGSGNNGTLTDGPAWTTGKYGAALSFDGSNDYVNITHYSFISEPILTYSAFVKTSSFATSGSSDIQLPVFPQLEDSSMQIGIDNGKPAIWYYDYGAPGWDKLWANVSVADDAWHHIVYVMNTTANTWSVYVDGVIDVDGQSLTGLGNLWIDGVGESRYGGQFDGKIDEVKVYNYARTQAQVAYDYNKGRPVAHYRFDEGAGTIVKNDSSSAHDGAAPVGWWRMDEASWNGTANEVVDSSGNAHHGVRVGNATTSSSSKIGPYTGTFDGTGDYVSISNWGAVPAQFTVTQWVNLVSGTTYWPSFSLAQDYDYGFTIHGSDGRIQGGNGAGNDYDTGNMFGEGLVGDGWRFIAVTYDGSIFRAYLDGVAKNTLSFSDGHPSATYTLKIGDFWGPEYKGQIDDTRFYDYVRTPEQVYNDYKSTHGTMVADTKFVDGKIGKALDFDGAGDTVVVPQANDFKFGTRDFTFSCWFNADDTDNDSGGHYDRLFFLGNDYQNDSISVNVQTDDSIHFRWEDVSPDLGTGANTISEGSWYHFVAVRNNGTLYLYVNGIQKNSTSFSTDINVAGDYELTIGAERDGANTSYFNGTMDDVCVYNYARTAAQIVEDYADGAARLGAQAAGVADPWGGALPVAHWKLDENTGVLARDASGNGNDGTLGGDGAGTDVPTWTQGKVGPALSFDGSDDYVSVADNASLDITGDITIGLWVKPGTTQKDYTDLLSKHSNGAYVIEQSGSSTNQFSFSWDTTGSAGWTGGSVNTQLTASEWQHFVVVKSGTSITHYLNGAQSATGSGSSATISTNSLAVRIGDWSSNSGRQFNGLIDDVCIYNYAFTQAQVSWLYNTGKPVGYWRMDEATTGAANGQTIYDDMKSNNITAQDGANNTGMTWAAGKFGGALSFDGVDDNADSSGITGVRSSTGTISYWIKPTTKDKTGGMFHLYEVSAADYIRSYIAANNNLDLYIEDDNVMKVGVTYDLDNLGAFENQWWHVTWVQDGSSVKLYINGQLKTLSGTNSGSWWTDHLASSLTLKLGYAWAAFQGLMDDLRIYNYARTADQIKQDYNNGVASKLSD